MYGGAGGGYSGGSGLNSGGYQAWGFGGGSYNGGTNQNNSVGNTGNGQVQITSTYLVCVSSTRTPVAVTVYAIPCSSDRERCFYILWKRYTDSKRRRLRE